MTSIPIYDESVPIACTADRGELATRVEQLEGLRTRLAGVERTEHGLLLRFPFAADLEADLRRFAVDEKGCCGFWGFAVEATSTELVLRWDGPPSVSGVLDELQAYFEGDEALTEAAVQELGLL
jgi:hypothetical protein